MRPNEQHSAPHSPGHPAPRHLISWGAALALAAAIALLPAGELLAGIGLALALALPLLSPAFGAYLAVLSVPVQELATLPGGLSYTQAAVLLAAAGWGLHLLVRRDAASEPLPRPMAAWLLLLLALLLSASLTPYSATEGLKETARWGGAFLIWLVAATSLRRRWQLYGLVACLLAAPAADAVIGLQQFVSGDGPPTFRIAPDLPYVRAYGTIGQPNSFAGYMNMAWPLALSVAAGATLGLWRDRRAGRRRLLLALLALGGWLLTAVLLAALLASFSRGAWLGAAAAALGLAAAASVVILAQDERAQRGDALARRRPSLRRRTVIALWSLIGVAVSAVIALSWAGLLPQPLASRLASIGGSLSVFDAGAVEVTAENFAVVERMAHLQAGARMLQARPLTGVGAGNFSVAYPDFAVGTWYASRGHAHNYYLHIAAEAGLIGLAAYLALLGSLVLQGINALRTWNGTLPQCIAVGCCGIIAAVAAHNLFENLHVLNMGIQLAGVWAALHAERLEP